jgi:hypothetical protein
MEWTTIWMKLKAKFQREPKAHQNNPNKKYIPVEWYENRANEVAGELYRKEIREFIVDPQHVRVVVRVYIGDTFRDGYGFRAYDQESMSNAVDLAFAEAHRNAFDSYEMGWEDLGIYERAGMRSPEVLCKKCQLPLSENDKEEIKKYPRLQVPYHPETCMPAHLKKT